MVLANEAIYAGKMNFCFIPSTFLIGSGLSVTDGKVNNDMNAWLR